MSRFNWELSKRFVVSKGITECCGYPPRDQYKVERKSNMIEGVPNDQFKKELIQMVADVLLPSDGEYSFYYAEGVLEDFYDAVYDKARQDCE